jgi:hypothetical protein
MRIVFYCVFHCVYCVLSCFVNHLWLRIMAIDEGCTPPHNRGFDHRLPGYGACDLYNAIRHLLTIYLTIYLIIYLTICATNADSMASAYRCQTVRQASAALTTWTTLTTLTKLNTLITLQRRERGVCLAEEDYDSTPPPPEDDEEVPHM